MKSLVIGGGEVGKSLYEVLSKRHECYIRDLDDFQMDGIEVLNICYPGRLENFIEITKKYIKQYKPKLTIIHSTVKPGTTRQCGEWVVHSPIHGKHPNLTQGIMTFVKYVGSHNIYASYMAFKYLMDAGIRAEVVSSPEASEISKILCTSYYGWNILFMKEVERICRQHNVPFTEIYARWNSYYNDGYDKLGMRQFQRPNLEPLPGRIGGHCVVENCDLLDSFITNTIKSRNKIYGNKESCELGNRRAGIHQLKTHSRNKRFRGTTDGNLRCRQKQGKY